MSNNRSCCSVCEIFCRIFNGSPLDFFGWTFEQTEVLYNFSSISSSTLRKSLGNFSQFKAEVYQHFKVFLEQRKTLKKISKALLQQFFSYFSGQKLHLPKNETSIFRK